MDFRWLHDFLALADIRNFRLAAERRNSSQPAFSRRIQSLEAWLGTSLIDRSAHPVRLTDAGERFVDAADAIIRQVMVARGALSGTPSDDGRAMISFSLPHSLALARFPQWWTVWSVASGARSCRVVSGSINEMRAHHVTRRSDILISFDHADHPLHLDPAHYRQVDLGLEWLRPYVSSRSNERHLVLAGKARGPSALVRYPSCSFLGRLVDAILAARQARMQTICEADAAEVLLRMAVAGHGIAWLPESTAADAVAAGRLRLAGDETWSMPMRIVAYSPRALVSPAVTTLMDFLADRPSGGHGQVAALV
ncbi:LysR family transcriptional regulator [Phreatobacter aquaticus]|uniref:LysR family transcriptional regulator n=1 Tax=Phreatobacter aquaticus TaxID=2570229 RepID=A0A4D7QNM2_9HYPH|nr:LysR family transcriptional regulator [Phreatobacter aquaticus]QCK87199.1 LysR family transcriptional regulator [Phreatobacter aquaticus]